MDASIPLPSQALLARAEEPASPPGELPPTLFLCPRAEIYCPSKHPWTFPHILLSRPSVQDPSRSL